MARCKRLFGGECKTVKFNCDRCGKMEAHVSLAGVIARKHHDEIVAFIADTHRRQHEEEDRASGTNHA